MRARPPGTTRPAPRPRPAPASLTADGPGHLFVYGTLMSGFVRRPLLGPEAVLEGRGRVRGSLYDFGDYSGVMLDEGWIVGELYGLDDLPRRLPELDRVRRRAPVVLADGSGREAWLCVYNGPPAGGSRIPSGDWRAHVAARSARSG